MILKFSLYMSIKMNRSILLIFFIFVNLLEIVKCQMNFLTDEDTDDAKRLQYQNEYEILQKIKSEKDLEMRSRIIEEAFKIATEFSFQETTDETSTEEPTTTIMNSRSNFNAPKKGKKCPEGYTFQGSNCRKIRN